MFSSDLQCVGYALLVSPWDDGEKTDNLPAATVGDNDLKGLSCFEYKM